MKKLTLSALGFVIVYNILFFQTDNGIGTGLLFLILNLFYFLFKKSEANINFALVCSLLSTFFGFLMGFRANEIVGLINLLSAIFFSMCALYFYKSSLNFSFEIPKFFLMPAVAITSSIAGFLSLFSSENDSLEGREKGIYTAFIRGLLTALPVLLILLVLLTRADPIFNKLVANLFKDIWERLFISAIVFVGLIAFGTTLIHERLKEDDVTKLEAAHKAYELLIILGSITFLFAAFLIVQFNYFFSSSGERELQTLGITSLTYSEYVRKGFFELLAVSTIAIVCLLYIMKFLHKLPTPQKLWTQIFGVSLTVEIGLLLISAGQRIHLYQAAHGLTRARIFGFIFLIWLGFMLLIFLARIIQELKKEILFTSLIVPTLGVLFLINILNIDGLIATKYRPSVNGEVDYYYLVSLSSDANPSWESAVLDAKATLTKLEPSKDFSAEEYRQLYWARSTLERLNGTIQFLKDKYGDYSKIKITNDWDRKKITRFRKWQSFNLGEFQAYQIILENKDLYNEVSGLSQKANDFDFSRVSGVIRQTAPLDRATQPPLL